MDWSIFPLGVGSTALEGMVGYGVGCVWIHSFLRGQGFGGPGSFEWSYIVLEYS